MTASVAEQILARVKTALTGTTAASTRVFRSREDAFDQEELPAINLWRRTGDIESHANTLNRSLLVFELDLHAQGAEWETAADALHVQVDGILDADATLATLGRGLRCTGTEALGGSADFVSGRITARYQVQFITRSGNLTRSIN